MKLHPQNVWWRVVCVALITMAAFAVSIEIRAAGSPEADAPSPSNPARNNDKKPPAGISENAWAKIVRQIKADRYNISKAPSTAGSDERYHAVNPANRLRVSFDQQGVEVRPLSEEDVWSLNMRLVAYGYEGALKESLATDLKVASNELQYIHGRVTEWYRNDERGLEQGFTVEKDEGKRQGDNLTVVLRASGSIAPKATSNGDSIAFYDKAGRMVLRYGSLLAMDAQGKTLPVKLDLVLTDGLNPENEIRISVDTTGACYPITIDPLFTAGEKKLTASDAAAGDYFGRSVAISGDTVVVGAQNNDDAGTDSGSAYIFSRNTGGADNWGQVKKLTASDAAAGDWFGRSVAISGDTVVLGADGNDDAGASSGSAYIFSRNFGGADFWGQVKKITASDAAAGDWFGLSLAISGDTVVVGAYGNDDAGAFSGSAYIFSRNFGGADNWGQVKKLTASDAATYDFFGLSVAISGDTVVVGAYGNDDAGAFSGSAYIFSRNFGGADNWGQVKKLTASDAAAGDWFGFSLAISGDTVVVGAYGNDDAGASSGSAYIFSRNFGGADNWGQVKKLTASDAATYDFFGLSVAISGDTVVVGADSNDDAGTDSGSAYIFSRNFGGADNWGQVKKLTASDATGWEHFGRSVAISGDTVVVGAEEKDNAGSAYIFTLTHGQWSQEKRQNAASATFGSSLAVNQDVLAVGAPQDGTNGAVYLFYRNSVSGPDTWEQKLKINGYMSGEQFGFSVALGGDKLVVGAPYYANGGKEGAAYVFYRNLGGPDSWGKIQTLTASSDGGGLFGWTVSLSGDKVAIGAPSNWYFAGSAYLFYRNQGGLDMWGEVRRINASDPWLLNQFGYTVSLNGDTLVIGAPFHDSDKGAVYIFSRNQGAAPDNADNWGQTQKRMANHAETGDHFGYGLSLNGDQLVVGAPDEDSQGESAGAVYVFYRNYGGTADNWGQVKKTLVTGGAAGNKFGWSVSGDSDAALVGANGGGAAYLLERNTGGGDQWGSITKFTPSDAATSFGLSLAMNGNIMAIGADSAAYLFQRYITPSVFYVDPSGLCNGYTPCYSTIQAAIVSAGSETIIKIRQGTYTESITLNESKAVALQGGWNTSFENQTGTTMLRQAPKAPQGSLSLQMLSIKPQ